VTRIRSLGAVMLATPIAVGFTVLSASSPAEAGSEISGPGTVTSGSSITVSAHIDNVVRVDLQVAAPGGGYRTIDSGGNLLGSTQLSSSVGIPRNGVYQARLKGSVTGKIYETKRFTVRVPPSAPSGVRAGVSGSKVVVRWGRGAEDDLVGYQVGASGVRSRTASASALCTGAACATTLSLPSTAGGRVGVSVRALRSDGSGGTVRSGTSTSQVTIPRGSGGTATSGHNATGSGSGAVDTPTVDPLNPLQNNSSVNLPGATPDGGTPGFQYPAPGPEVADPQQAGPNAENVSATSSLEWGKSLAIALVLLIVAAHLGTWTRRTRVAQALAGRVRRTGAGRDRVRAAREQIARAEAEARSASAGAADAAAGHEKSSAASVSPATRRSGKTTGKTPAKTTGKTPGRTPRRSRPVNEPASGPGPRGIVQAGAAKAPGRPHGGYRGRRRAQ
jgi:hypothetical protein